MTSQCPPRAKRTVTHCCTRERAMAQHKHTQHVHSVSDTQHRERSTACLVCHMLRVRCRLSSTASFLPDLHPCGSTLYSHVGGAEPLRLRTRDFSVSPARKKDSHTLLYTRARHGTTQAHTTRAFIHFISFHFISFHFISFHFISFHFISFHFISFHFISFHFISFHFISFHFISFHFISFHFISFHFISFHFISFHFISFHFISFHSLTYLLGFRAK